MVVAPAAMRGAAYTPYVDFEDALQRTPPIERVGELRLRYETSLLIAEPPAPKPDTRLQLLRLGGASLIALALATVVASTDGKPPINALVVALLGTGLLAAAPRLFPAPRRRRFVLNFASESLRIDDLGAQPRTRVLHFDEIAALAVEPDHSGGFQLVLSAKAPPTREVLVERVLGEDVEELRRLWRVLTDAFGIRRPGVEL